MELNGVILIDKEQDWTSHDVVAKLRGILREKRIGHSGTLDPMATGLLVIFIGKATKAVEFAEADEKEYISAMKFGISTDTQDTTGNVLATCEVSHSEDDLETALASFRGEIEQIPPMFSAIKIDGQRLYKLARKGKEVERKSRKITIKTLEKISDVDGDTALRVVCSKGTYIRTLCHDIGQKLGCGATMSYLRRTRAGAFSVESAHTISQLQEIADNGGIEDLIKPVDELFSDFDKLMLNDYEEKKCRVGNSFKTRNTDGNYRAYAQNGEFLMLCRIEDGVAKSIKNFY